ncbi:hypothetical protein BDN71DRAFT_893846 [Pleurotus eryngii]|uniref:Uncharacterized protein n=1 Tax=Pleurotus eryngii TaxID=5323 RepID=A0A9P6D8G6_PLEER|nr:hypothetical protein BDN71DRAFT_893846 [Pleurotus eryngii]
MRALDETVLDSSSWTQRMSDGTSTRTAGDSSLRLHALLTLRRDFGLGIVRVRTLDKRTPCTFGGELVDRPWSSALCFWSITGSLDVIPSILRRRLHGEVSFRLCCSASWTKMSLNCTLRRQSPIRWLANAQRPDPPSSMCRRHLSPTFLLERLCGSYQGHATRASIAALTVTLAKAIHCRVTKTGV